MTTTETRRINLHDRALEVFNAAQAEEEQRMRALELERRERALRHARNALERVFSLNVSNSDLYELDSDNGFDAHMRFKVDGLTFNMWYQEDDDPSADLHYVGSCVDCGNDVERRGPVETIKALGWLLSEWEPVCDACRIAKAPPPRTPTRRSITLTEQQLVEAVRDIIREETRYA
jgi:hypothetical protein